MTKRQVAVSHLRTGKPLHLIAQAMDVSFQTIVRYMKLQVAEGGVTASEVFFGIDPVRRNLLQGLLRDSDGKASRSYYRDAAAQGISWDEANLYWAMALSTANRGDMYERIADLEVGLHQHIKDVLAKEFGDTESAWWRNGVPLPSPSLLIYQHNMSEPWPSRLPSLPTRVYPEPPLPARPFSSCLLRVTSL